MLIRNGRGRSHRTKALVLCVGTLLTLLGPLQQAHAQTRWICTFAPSVTNPGSSLFSFASKANADDILQIYAKGSCYDSGLVSCQGFVCRAIPTYTATISGLNYEDASIPVFDMRFGTCDKDALRGDQVRDRLQVPYMFFDLAIRSVGTFHINMQILGDEMNQPVFPGPGESLGHLYSVSPTRQDDIGTITVRTRIGGNCPPDGNYSATYRIDVMLPVS